jgi:hypothetical protein
MRILGEAPFVSDTDGRWLRTRFARFGDSDFYFNFTNSRTKIAHTPTVTGN